VNDATQESPTTVLIVDDSKLTRVSLKSMLRKSVMPLQLYGEAEDGQQALELLATETLPPQVILMDIGMPILDGIKTTEIVRQRYPNVNIIMLTSHESDEDILAAFRSGATSYCLKDTAPEKLQEVILGSANGSRWIDPRIARVVLNLLEPTSTQSRTTSQQDLKGNTLGAVPLTERELDVLKLLSEGRNNAEISAMLFISMNTVKTHLKNIFQKLEVEDRTAAALKALKKQLV
jgi:two-component system, NarL family, response regulator LiaR